MRLGQTGRAGQVLAGLSDQDREHGEIRIATAELRLAHGDPRAALAALVRTGTPPSVPCVVVTSAGRGLCVSACSIATRCAATSPVMLKGSWRNRSIGVALAPVAEGGWRDTAASMAVQCPMPSMTSTVARP